MLPPGRVFLLAVALLLVVGLLHPGAPADVALVPSSLAPGSLVP